MKKNGEIENIFNHCLERMDRGDSIEQCLDSYPEQAAELGPMLWMAQTAKETSAISPRWEFRERARYEFRAALQEGSLKNKRPLFGIKKRFITAVVSLSVVLVLGCGTVVMASNSMPDNPLYVVKLASEEVQMVLTPSDIDKAKVCVMQADRRVDEIVYLAERGDVQQVEVAADRLDKCLETLGGIAQTKGTQAVQEEVVPEVYEAMPDDMADEDWSGDDADLSELKITVVYHAASNQSALIRKLIDAPDSVKPALHRAITVSTMGYEHTLTSLD
jgi:hypothetical protein